MQWAKQKGFGFTIVELLIVVVVIAILAAITIVAYSGIQNQAKSSRIASEFSQASRLLEVERTSSSNSQYPSSLPTSLGTSNFTYNRIATSSEGYCLIKNFDGKSYFITSANTTPTPGTCDNLVLWLPFNNSSNEVSGHNTTSTPIAVSYTSDSTGLPNKAANFNGTTSYVDLGNPSQLPNGTSARTMCSWSNLQSTNTTFGMIFSYGSTTSMSGMFIGRMNNSNTGVTGGFGGSNIIHSNFWVIGEWHHICATFNGTTGTIYKNGISVASANWNWNLVRNLAYVGRQLNGLEYWHGQIDDVRVYSKALNAAEVSELYSYGPQ